jgi:serine/threonine protein phosphatase PrpC
MKVDYYKYSNVGERKVNEDCVGTYQDDDFYAFALCDGLGGHSYGEQASNTAVYSMLDCCAKSGFNDNLINECFECANNELVKKVQDNPEFNNMKTTATLMIIYGDKASWAHIGDSRIYYFSKNRFVKRTLDHSVPQMLAQAGRIREKDIRHHIDRNKLLRCLPWDNKIYEVDENNFLLKSGDSFIMMSDGFWDWIDEKEMHKALKKGKSAKDVADILVDTAFKHGQGNNMDNLSLIIIKIS